MTSFFVGDADKHVRQIEDPSVSTDIGANVSWEIESKDFTLQTRKHFPRWVKYDVDIDDATSVSGKVILDGATHHTHPLIVTGKRSRLYQ